MSARAAETAGIAALLSPSLPAFAVPEEKRGLPVPGLRRLLEPGANLGRVLWMLAVGNYPPPLRGSGLADSILACSGTRLSG
jgi:hypothetical protein